MVHSALTPVFVGLRTALHILFVGLVGLVVVRAVVEPSPHLVAVSALSVSLLITYALGGVAAHASSTDRRMPAHLWLAALFLEWLALVWLIPEGAYLVFPLFFLLLHLLPRLWGVLAVILATALAIVALGLHGGWSIGGVVGPLVGAGVSIVIGLGYRSLAREAAEREQLVAELLATRDQLAATEREAGALAERARLAREIHDTVAQGLSSIQMLLNVAEMSDPHRPGVEHIRLARETAATNLSETRSFIRELSPPALAEQGLGAALRRLAETQWKGTGAGAGAGADAGGAANRTAPLVVRVLVADAPALPMHVQTALFRIAQGAMANVLQHASAGSATIAIDRQGEVVRMTVADDGSGFDLAAAAERRASGDSDSFGLTAVRERVEQLGGTLSIETAPGAGTTLTVELTVGDE